MPHEMSPGKPNTRRYSEAETDRAVLAAWVKQAERDELPGALDADERAELEWLRRENRDLKGRRRAPDAEQSSHLVRRHEQRPDLTGADRPGVAPRFRPDGHEVGEAESEVSRAEE